MQQAGAENKTEDPSQQNEREVKKEIENQISEPKPSEKKEVEAESEKADAFLKEWVGLVCRAVIWALLIYTFIFQVSVVNGRSMEPNFQDRNRLLIDKLTYRFSDPEPGDVIVFQMVVRENKDSNRLVTEDYIKRVIAGPGDEVKIFKGQVFVNGELLNEPWDPLEFPETPWHARFDSSYRKRWVVPKNRYFVLGDNRKASTDSRESKIGFVPRNAIKGKVRCRFAPLNEFQWY